MQFLGEFGKLGLDTLILVDCGSGAEKPWVAINHPTSSDLLPSDQEQVSEQGNDYPYNQPQPRVECRVV